MILRRCLYVLSLLPVLVVAETESLVLERNANWRFDVYLDDKRIGWHEFGLQSSANGDVVLETQAEFDVKLLFVTVFSYEHRAQETWNNGCLRTIDAATRQNTKRFTVRGNDDGQGLALLQPEASMPPIPCARSFAYWNPEILDASSLLNSQTGLVEAVTITPIGERSLDISGQQLQAREYAINTAKGDIRVWYEVGTRRWLALEAPAKGGRKLRYQAVALPDLELVPLLELAGGRHDDRTTPAT